MNLSPFQLESYDYNLPKELIAQKPCSPAEDARLLLVNCSKEGCSEAKYKNLPEIIPEESILFFNDSKVIPARLHFSASHVGGKEEKQAEIFYLGKNEDGENQFEAFVFPGKLFPIGKSFEIFGAKFIITGTTKKGRMITIQDGDIGEILQKHGSMPLPPYIADNPELYKEYQTVFAQKDGSLAAPTASLHFSKKLLDGLIESGKTLEFLTLHVGLGTFESVATQDIRDFAIHTESFEIANELFEKIAQYKFANRKIIAVGTTSLRVLESLPSLYNEIRTQLSLSKGAQEYWDAKIPKKNLIQEIKIFEGMILAKTQIFIYPGYTFQIIDELITNFHLPKSSLLMLVSSLLGVEKTKQIYEFAIENKFRFFSFGDGMYIQK